MRGLMIEDDPNIAEAVSFGLERLSLQPQLAPTWEKGVEMVRVGAADSGTFLNQWF